MPTYESSTISDFFADYSNSFDLDYPANIASGDLLIIDVKGFGSASTTGTASGFTVVEFTTNDRGSCILAKIATGSESGTVTVTLPGMSDIHCCMYRITNHGVSNIGTDLTAVARDDTAVVSSPQVTGATDGSMVIVTMYSKPGTASNPTTPSTFTQAELVSTQSNASRFHTAYNESTSGTTLGAYSWTNSGVVASTLAIPPAAASGSAGQRINNGLIR